MTSVAHLLAGTRAVARARGARARHKSRRGIVVTCDQCDRPGADVLGRTRNGFRCSCRRCGAVFRTSDLSRPAALSPPAAPEPVLATVLAPFVPAQMLAWLRASGAPDAIPRAVADRETLVAQYARFDKFVRDARRSPKLRSLYDAGADVPLEDVPATLPSFAQVVDVLHRCCYDQEASVRTLVARTAPGGAQFVRDRVSFAARWLASASGRAYRWIDEDVPPLPASPQEVERLLLAPGALAGKLDAEGYALLQRALFGTSRGPSLPDLAAHFSRERIDEALRGYVQDGSRPLRDEVLTSIRATATTTETGAGD